MIFIFRKCQNNIIVNRLHNTHGNLQYRSIETWCLCYISKLSDICSYICHNWNFWNHFLVKDKFCDVLWMVGSWFWHLYCLLAAVTVLQRQFWHAFIANDHHKKYFPFIVTNVFDISQLRTTNSQIHRKLVHICRH